MTESEGVVIIGPEPNSGLIIKYLLPPKGTAKYKSSLSDVSNTSLKLWRTPLNNVININGTVEGISELINSGYGEAEFDTSRSPLQYEAMLNNGRSIKSELNKYAIYRTDTGACLGDHGLKYKVVDHKDMIDSARRILQKSTLNLDGIQENISVGDGGSVCFVKHLLPEHTITTPDGDEGELTFLAVNSYNSKMAYWQSVGILQSACTNGQVFTRGAASVYKNRHTKSLSLDRAAAIISNIVGILHEENEIWHKWAETPTNSKEMFPIFAEAAGSRKALDCLKAGDDMFDILRNEKSVRNNKALNYMLNAWANDYAPRMGQNLWAAYNALTDWSSHFTPESTKRTPVIDAPMVSYKNSETVRDIITDNSVFKIAA